MSRRRGDAEPSTRGELQRLLKHPGLILREPRSGRPTGPRSRSESNRVPPCAPSRGRSFRAFGSRAPDSPRSRARPAIRATVSPCFDADALFLPTRRHAFFTLPSGATARRLTPRRCSSLPGSRCDPCCSLCLRRIPEGRDIHVVNTTTTVTLGVGFGLGHGLRRQRRVRLRSVSGRHGSRSRDGATAPPLGSAAVRDPRIGFELTRCSDETRAIPIALVCALGLRRRSATKRCSPARAGRRFDRGSASRPKPVASSSAPSRAFGCGAPSFRHGAKGAKRCSVSALAYSVFVGRRAWGSASRRGFVPGSLASRRRPPPTRPICRPNGSLEHDVRRDSDSGFSLAAAGGSGLPLLERPLPFGLHRVVCGRDGTRLPRAARLALHPTRESLEQPLVDVDAIARCSGTSWASPSVMRSTLTHDRLRRFRPCASSSPYRRRRSR